MKLMKKLSIRLYQKILYLATFFLNIKEPIIIRGENSFSDLANLLKRKHINNVLLVTGSTLHSLNMDKLLYDELIKENINFTLYYNFKVDPTIEQVNEGLKKYKESKSECIIVIGGGSAIDGAKGIAALATNPNKTIEKMKGILKVKHKLPLFIAIPTTAGTGSETTLAAVISNPETKDKFAIEDPHLIPTYAVLNPKLLIDLPAHVTSTTGMDALTHAIEAYIGKANTKKTKQAAKRAIQSIFTYLKLSYDNPKNLLYREKMQVAAYDAGIAFTRAYVGNVHAIAHALGGFYHVPHGLANAVILPIVLKEYGSSIYGKLASLYDLIEPNNLKNNKEKSEKFIEKVENLNKELNITNKFKDLIKDEDIPLMVDKAYKEAIPLYPTPILFNKKTFYKIFKILQNN